MHSKDLLRHSASKQQENRDILKLSLHF